MPMLSELLPCATMIRRLVRCTAPSIMDTSGLFLCVARRAQFFPDRVGFYRGFFKLLYQLRNIVWMNGDDSDFLVVVFLLQTDMSEPTGSHLYGIPLFNDCVAHSVFHLDKLQIIDFTRKKHRCALAILTF